jgi:acetyl esterase/lipase
MEDILHMKPITKKDPLEDSTTFVKNLRASLALDNVIPKPSQCEINNETFEYDGHQVQTYWVNYPPRKFQRNSGNLLLYFHGGGYVVGHIHGELFDHISKVFI